MFFFSLLPLGLNMVNVDMISCNTIPEHAYTLELSLINLSNSYLLPVFILLVFGVVDRKRI